MQIQTTTIPAVTLTMPADEARSYLADPTPLLDELREVLAAQAAANSTRKNDIAYGQAVKEQPKLAIKRQKRFLARSSGSATTPMHACDEPGCTRTFKTAGRLRNHLRDSHGRSVEAALAAD